MKSASIAKISRPKLSGIVKRDRLFRLLDQGKHKPVIWVTAQGGSGKTTLVASWLDSRKLPCLWYQVDEGDADIASFFYYMGMAAKHAAPRYKNSLPLLTPEYLQSIPVFTRRYFEALFSRLSSPTLTKGGKGGFVVVLDNYQDAPLASGFHDMIAHGLETIPEGITVIIQSRAAPPPQLSRLQANNRLHLVGGDDVRFSREESSELLGTQSHDKPSSEILELLHNKTEGWAAGLILLAGAGSTASASKSLADMTAGSLFDYFASEIFSKTDASIQDVLLKTSFLQKIDPAMAEQLTGNAMSGQILERMSRDHFFTQKYGQAYQYHPLFREFLQSRAKTNFSSADRVAVQRKAAGLAEQAGNEEEAVGLYIAVADWSSAERVVLKQAPTLVSQGRSNTLEAWLNNLPSVHIGNASWSLYWLGICRIAYNPAEARGYFEKAFLHFNNNADVPGLFLSWACIVDTFVYEWGDFRPLDHWLAVADKLIADHPEFPSPEIEARFAAGMLNAMTWRQPYRADLPEWAERVRQIALHHPSVQLRIMLGNFLIIYYLFMGDFAKAGLLIDALRPVSDLKENDPLTRQNWHVMEAMYSWFMADGAACMKALTNGLRNAEESGIHLLDLYLLGQGVYSGISLGDLPAAETSLKKMSGINSPRLMDKSFYQFQASTVAWRQGDLKKAIEHGKAAVEFAGDVGCPLAHALCIIELALSFFDDGQHEEAKKHLARGGEIARGMNAIEFMHLMLGARFAFDLGEQGEGLALLKRGLALGSRQGYVNISRWNNGTMSRLCALALEHNIEPDYTRKLITVRNLALPESLINLDAWPWPIKIITLGRFEIVRGGKPVEFSGKVQQKPLELLKALIALGSMDVSYEQLSTALWPDAEGDKAYQSLEVALHRLRKLMGDETAIQRQGGRISLNQKYCWCDALVFEKTVDEALDPRCTSEIFMKLNGRAVGLYQANFLAGELEKTWAIALRERLGSKYMRLIKKTGGALERSGQLEQAIEHYHNALDVNQIAEEFYQGLMGCYHRLGRQAEAISAYNQCSRVLSATTGLSPSAKTEDIYRALTSATQ